MCVTDLRIEALGESFHAAQSVSQLHAAAVQKHTQKSVSSTGVRYQLHTTIHKQTIECGDNNSRFYGQKQ